MQLLEMKWPEVKALPRTTPVVVPVAALEQHGAHMPLFTDSLLLGEVVRRASQALDKRVLFVPLTWIGNSHHHLDFAGTISAGPRLYLDLLEEVVDNLIGHGFQRIVLLNGHGGNIVPAQQATFEIRQKYRERQDLLLLSATYWTLGGKPFEVDRSIRQQRMGHACEWETSMMLRIRPELVGDLSRVEPVEFGTPFEPAHRAWVTQDRTTAGHIGDPRYATAEKGEVLFTVFTADVVALLERVIDWNGHSWDG